jgi:putative membrane protein insertion efficiency factor
MRRAAEWAFLVPRNLLVAFLLGYRKWISPLYGDVCRYYPSCSSYGLQQVQQRGAALGIVLAAWRILRCNPFTKGGVDEVKPGNGRYSVTAKGFVVPRVLIAKEGK